MGSGVRRVVAVGTWVFALAACGAESGDEVGDTPASSPSAVGSAPAAVMDGIVRGMLVMGPEVRTLKPCDEETELWVIPVESVQRAYDQLASEPYAPVFVEVEGSREASPASGFGADYPGQLRLTALHRAEPAEEGFGCGEQLRGVVFRAGGQEPFWHVRVLADRITLATPEIPSTVFAQARPIPLDDGWRFESLSSGPETVQLRLDLTRGRCTDSMVGSVYTWTAMLDVGGELRRGCAWEGALAPGRSASPAAG